MSKATNPAEIIPRPVLNTPTIQGVWSASNPVPKPLPTKKKFILQDKAGETVATLIDRDLAEKWVSEGRKGSMKITEGVLVLAV
jgi:hypothetical protein